VKKKDASIQSSDNSLRTDRAKTWTGLFLALIGIALIIASFFLLQQKFFASPKIETLFSNDSTVGFWKTENQKDFSLISALFLPEEMEKKIAPYRGKENAILWFDTVESGTPLFFFEKEGSILKKTEEEVKILAESFSTAPENGCISEEKYFVCSSLKQMVFLWKEEKEKNPKKLSADKDFEKIEKQFSETPSWGFIRSSNIENLLLTFLEKGSFSPEEKAFWGERIKYITPIFSQVVTAVAFSTDNESLRVVFVKKNPNAPLFESISTFYSDSVVRLPDNTSAFISFSQGQEIYETLFAAFREADPAKSLSLQYEIQKYIRTTFSQEISIQEDISPLFSGIASLSLIDNVPLLSFSLPTELLAQKKGEKFLFGIRNFAENFYPEIIEHTLEDGTVIREIFPNPKAVQETKEETPFGNRINIITEQNNEKKYSFSLQIFKNILLFSPEKSLLEEYFLEKSSRSPVLMSGYDIPQKKETRAIAFASSETLMQFFPKWNDFFKEKKSFAWVFNEDEDTYEFEFFLQKR
jgi:hypothetical protein